LEGPGAEASPGAGHATAEGEGGKGDSSTVQIHQLQSGDTLHHVGRSLYETDTLEERTAMVHAAAAAAATGDMVHAAEIILGPGPEPEDL